MKDILISILLGIIAAVMLDAFITYLCYGDLRNIPSYLFPESNSDWVILSMFFGIQVLLGAATYYRIRQILSE